GLRLLDGPEAEQFRLDSTWNVERHVRDLFQKIEVKGEKDKETGRAVECLELTPKNGPSVTNCYDALTHLQVSQRGIAATPQGNVPYSSRIKAWKEIEGLKVPALIEMSTGPIDLTLKVAEV